MRTPFMTGALAALAFAPSAAHADDLVYGGKLLLTRGVTNVEGAGGGGLASWALITGNETERGIGGTAFATHVSLSDYEFRAVGAAIGIMDRVELSYARQEFDTEGTGAALGLGAGFTFAQDVYGAKVRVLGDAVYDQDFWLPQVAIGAQWKRNNQPAIVGAVGGRDNVGVDYYVAATKVFLEHSVLVNATVRFTEGNQFGLLGFGGDQKDERSAQIETSIGYLVSDRLLVGAELRTRPDNLGFAEENDAFDVFAAYAVNDHFTVTAAYVDLGSIATVEDQHGFYISLQAGF